VGTEGLCPNVKKTQIGKIIHKKSGKFLNTHINVQFLKNSDIVFRNYKFRISVSLQEPKSSHTLIYSSEYVFAEYEVYGSEILFGTMTEQFRSR
jgi:hypothetical protein